MNMNCVFCGPVKNCAPFLETVLSNIEKIATLFENYVIILYYDHSTDNTLDTLKRYQRRNNRLHFYVNIHPVSQFRTHRIANARNFCMEQIRQHYADYPYFIMMDFDEPNCKNCNILPLQKYLMREKDKTEEEGESNELWDALSFNTSPKYYDIWGLSIYPFCFSYNHFNNNQQFYHTIQDYVDNKLKNLKNDELLPCISAFNGFAIYRTQKFLNCEYDGRVNLNLVPPSYMAAHMKAANSPLIYKDYGHVKGRYEDCEHRAFHVQAINKNNAKIRIAPEVIFG